jgi:hypothetical protein
MGEIAPLRTHLSLFSASHIVLNPYLIKYVCYKMTSGTVDLPNFGN